jgi:hypothetical protein
MLSLSILTSLSGTIVSYLRVDSRFIRYGPVLSYMKTSGLTEKILGLDRRCRYACILDRDGKKIAESVKKGLAPRLHGERANLENVRSILRHRIAEERKFTGRLQYILTSYERETTLIRSIDEAVVLVSFDPAADLDLVKSVLELVGKQS